MESAGSLPNTVRFVSIKAPELEQYAINDKDGRQIYVYDAAFIRILSKGLRARYEVLMPPDGEFGKQLPNGSWTGMIGMVKRSEADIAMNGVSLTEERRNAVSFAYPHLMSALTFMTDKPEPLPSSLAIFYPFSSGVWIMILLSLIAASVALYALLRKRETYQRVLLNMVGTLLNMSFAFGIRRDSPRLLAFGWLLAAFILSNSYKGVLLAFLSFPPMIGIRDIPELSKYAAKDAIKCYTYKGSFVFKIFANASLHSWKAVGDCLKRNEISSGDIEDAFMEAPSRKAFVAGKLFMQMYSPEHFISEDSFSPIIYAFPFSKKFCCPDGLDKVIHRLSAAGIFEKQLRNEHLVLQLRRTSRNPRRLGNPAKLQLEDVSGAFVILVSGWILAFLVLLVERFKKQKRRRKARRR